MIIHRTILAAALAAPFTFATPFTVAITSAAHADELQPIEGRTINLGQASGVVYYTVERDGFRVVATFAQGEGGRPVRIEAILTPGQSVVLSTPNAAGVAPETVEIRRRDDRIVVQAAPVTN